MQKHIIVFMIIDIYIHVYIIYKCSIFYFNQHDPLNVVREYRPTWPGVFTCFVREYIVPIVYTHVS